MRIDSAEQLSVLWTRKPKHHAQLRVIQNLSPYAFALMMTSIPRRRPKISDFV